MALAGFGDSLEGFHAVAAAVAASRVVDLWIEASRVGQRDFADLAQAAEATGARVRIVDDVTDFATTSAPQGVVARARPIQSHDLDGLVNGDSANSDPPALMVLDHIIDPHNLGAIARSSRAAGMSGLVVANRRAAPLSAVAFKAAAGALETIPVAIVSSIADAVSRLKKAGVWTVGLAGGSTTSLFGFELLSESVAVVVGEEGGGLSRLVGERCDVIASIPMVPGVDSLNASVAASLAAYEVMRIRAR
jgi:23S rRNA (guanosine2251-2'-O)-methyltransferase